MTYIHRDLLNFYKDVVKAQYNEPERFIGPCAPLRHTLGICGRKGVKKTSGLIALLKKDEIPHKTITLEPSIINDCGDLIYKHMLDLQDMSTNREGICGILIIERADFATMEPKESKTSILFRDWERVAKEMSLLIIAIFDHVPPITNRTLYEYYLTDFMKQFPEMYWIPSPNADTRALYLENTITQWAKNTQITLEMEAQDWVLLASYSKWATFDEIDTFVNRVCRRAVIFKSKTLTRGNFEAFMSNAIGSPHICIHNCRKLEEPYSLKFGHGPLDAISKPNPNAGFNAPKGYKLVKVDEEGEEEKEGEKDNLNITEFTTDMVELENVKDAIETNHKTHKTRKRRRNKK